MKRILLLVLTFIISGILCAQPTDGLIAFFKWNGNMANTGSASLTATPVNTTYTTNFTGTANTAVQFAGNQDSYVDFTDNGNADFTGTNNFSVAFSFYFNGTASSGLIDNCVNYGGWGIYLWEQTAGIWIIQFSYKNGSVGSAAATAFTRGTWHHVAAVRNNGILSLYIDGVFRLSGAEGTLSPSYPVNMIAGVLAYSLYSPPRYVPFNGKMNQVAIYNRALSAAEVTALNAFTLPLKLLDFNGHIVKKSAELEWKTAEELNTRSFDIERSTDGINYTTVGNLPAYNTAGEHQYHFTDENITSLGVPVVYYRLKQKDIDDRYTYSRIIVLSMDDNRSIIMLYPNPVNDEANLTITVDKKQALFGKVLDNAGRVVKSIQWNLPAGSISLRVDLKKLAKGIYFLELKGGSINERKKFIKQ